MACCYCCCGQAICGEGQQGKCCCGGVGGECCSESEYCCEGSCQATPCGCECPNPCTFIGTASATEWGLTVTAAGTPDDCDTCSAINEADSEGNPNRPDDQPALSSNELAAIAGLSGPAGSWSMSAGATETYVVPSAGGFTSDYEEYKSTSYSGLFSCEEVDGVATWTGTFGFLYSHSILSSPSGVPEKFQQTVKSCTLGLTFSDECPSPCPITASLSPDGVTVNGVTGSWECGTDTQECTEYDEEGNETPCTDYLDSPMDNATFTLECREECEEVEPMSLAAGPGTELKKLLKTIGIEAKPGCKCNKRAQTMDEKGCDWCAENLDLISAWLQEEAEKRGLPYIPTAGKWIINLAIKRARRGIGQ